MQIDAFYLLKNKIESENIHLIMAGGVRNEGDEMRAAELEGISLLKITIAAQNYLFQVFPQKLRSRLPAPGKKILGL